MKGFYLALLLATAVCGNAKAQTPEVPSSKPICVYPGSPSAEFDVIRALRVGKGTYGSVTEITPVLIKDARSLGADAIINFAATQRFGFFPWRLVRPVAHGTAVKWKAGEVVDCTATGGTLN